MLQKLREKMKSTQRGAIMVFFALLVPLFLGMIGFAVDAGFLYMQKAKLQDIADAAALAGAGHLNDGDNIRGNNVTQAVKAFGGANGMADKATSSSYVYLNSQEKENDEAIKAQLTDKYPWRIAQAIDEQMTDKDGKNRDHVRVIIWKRVPTFFIRFLFPDDEKYKYVVVKAMAAAEYVAGEAPVISGGDPVIMAGVLNQNYNSDKNITLGQNFPFSVYGYACSPDPFKLPGKGTLYSSNLSGGISWSYDKDKKVVVFNPPLPEGRDYIPSNNWSTYDTYWAKEQADQQIALGNAMKQKFYDTLIAYENKTNAEVAKIQEYKDGVDNKRYIGKDASGKVICNIKDDDKNNPEGIDLYISGTYAEKFSSDSNWLAEGRSVLTNRQLKGVTKINTLLVDKYGMIGTSGVTYGNIYCINSAIMVGGSDNYFNGTVYSPDQIWVGGENNHFLSKSTSSDSVGLLCKNTLHVGLWNPISERIVKTYSHYDNEKKEDVYVDSIQIDFIDTFKDESNNPNWHMYWGGNGTGSSSSGSSGSDTASKSRVRLVI